MNDSCHEIVVTGAVRRATLLAITFVVRKSSSSSWMPRTASGRAWLHTWDSLRLFSPAAYSSLHRP